MSPNYLFANMATWVRFLYMSHMMHMLYLVSEVWAPCSASSVHGRERALSKSGGVVGYLLCPTEVRLQAQSALALKA